MAIRRTDTFPIGGAEQQANALIAALGARSWQRLSAGAGARGPREHHWARIPIPGGTAPGRARWLLARRSLADPSEIAYYACYGPSRTRLVDLAWVAGSRWHIEECFQQAKGEAGLHHYQLRTWRAWYAHITLSMLALAWLAASRAQAVKGNRHQRPGHDRLHATGDPPPAGQLDPGSRTRPRSRLVLVPLAPATPVPGPAMPLPAARLWPHLSAPLRHQAPIPSGQPSMPAVAANQPLSGHPSSRVQQHT
jgi:hypothetical protein